MAEENDKKETVATTTNATEFHHPDGGFGWVVCLASFWCNGTIFGVLNMFGVIYPELLVVYGGADDKDIAFKTSWVGSLATGMTFFMSPVTSILVDRFGIRPIAFIGAVLSTAGLLVSSFVNHLGLLYLTYGILLGLGSSMAYTPSLVILGHYFQKKLGLVNGLVTTGSAVFTIALPFILKVSLTNIGLAHTLQILAGLNSVLLACALIYKPLIIRQDNAMAFMSATSMAENYHEFVLFIRRYLNIKIWRNKSYVIWVMSMGISLLGYFIPFVHLVKHVNDTMPGKNGEILVMCIGATSGVGRIVAGKLADMQQVNRIRLHQFSIAIMGVITIIIPFATYFEVLLVLTLLMGLCDGCMVCLLGPIAFDIVGQKGAAQAVGFLLGVMSIPLMLGPPIAGFMYDLMGKYDAAFWAAGAPPLLGATIMFLIPSMKQQFPAVTETEEFIAAHEDLEDTAGEVFGSAMIWAETGEKRQHRRTNETGGNTLLVPGTSSPSGVTDSEQIPMMDGEQDISQVQIIA